MASLMSKDEIFGRVRDTMVELFELDAGAITLDAHLIAIGTQPTVCSDQGVAALSPDQTVFCVVLVDAKGHRGDPDCTGTLTRFE